MGFIENLKKKWVRAYIDSILVKDRSHRERCKWRVIISGVHINDLGPNPIEMPFSNEKYLKTRDEAEDLGKIENKEGNEVEIWKLVKRYGSH